jgi:hypothetical protein
VKNISQAMIVIICAVLSCYLFNTLLQINDHSQWSNFTKSEVTALVNEYSEKKAVECSAAGGEWLTYRTHSICSLDLGIELVPNPARDQMFWRYLASVVGAVMSFVTALLLSLEPAINVTAAFLRWISDSTRNLISPTK